MAVLAIAVAIVGLLAYAIATRRSVTTNSSNTIQVTTSFYPLYFFTTRIAGELATVYNITPAGAEPHDYEPTPQDIAHIEDSALLVLNGGALEAWGEDEVEALQGSSTAVLVVGEDLADQTVEEDSETVRDPHVWLDPVRAKTQAQRIADELIHIDPSHADAYRMNVATLFADLDRLDREFVSVLSTCQKNAFVTSHNAFGYLAERYDLTQVSILGLSPDEEPSAEALAQVVDFAQLYDVSYIFFESLVSPKLAETLANEVGAQTLVLNPLEGLTQEELARGENYITVMQQNLANLQTALVCQ